MDFNQFPWHDSTLLELVISRRSPGTSDVVDLVVSTPDDRVIHFSFTNCYGFECTMNFGIVATESIREGSCCEDSEALRELRMRWAIVGVDLEGLIQYELRTNSTNSVLRVFARTVTAKEEDDDEE